MTNEKAIEVIKAECYVFNPLDLDKTVLINQALDRAVDALKNRSDQQINVNRLLELFDQYCDRCGNPYKQGGLSCRTCRFRDARSIVNTLKERVEIPDSYEEEETEEERNRRLCRENYAAQMESLGYNADGNKK